MKTILTSILLVISFSTLAQAATPVFSCAAKIDIDVNEVAELGMTVVQETSGYVSYLIGSGETGAIETTVVNATLTEALQIGGLHNILAATKLSKQDYAKIASVTVYTAGNFEDDAAGVRSAVFADAKGAILAKGMFFGWAGAMSCLH